MTDSFKKEKSKMWLIECFIAGFIEKILILFKNVYNVFYKIINFILSFNDKNKIDKILSSKEKKEFNLIDEIDNFTTKDIFEFDNEQQQILYRNLLLKYKNTNFVLLCSPCKRLENTDTLKTATDLQIFYAKFGFVRTNELLPTMIYKAI